MEFHSSLNPISIHSSKLFLTSTLWSLIFAIPTRPSGSLPWHLSSVFPLILPPHPTFQSYMNIQFLEEVFSSLQDTVCLLFIYLQCFCSKHPESAFLIALWWMSGSQVMGEASPDHHIQRFTYHILHTLAPSMCMQPLNWLSCFIFSLGIYHRGACFTLINITLFFYF